MALRIDEKINENQKNPGSVPSTIFIFKIFCSASNLNIYPGSGGVAKCSSRLPQEQKILGSNPTPWRQGVGFIGLNTLQCCCQNLKYEMSLCFLEKK
jgi:hypothetical protein